VELIFSNISSKVLTLRLGLESDIFTLQANSPTHSSFDSQYQTSKCINSFLDSDVKKRVKNKLCFILCQEKAFEDKMNCQFQRVSSILRSQYSLQIFIFQLVEACHQYNKHKTDIINICNALFVIFHQYNFFREQIMCRHVPKVPYGS
jgi:hypothetical protein